MAVRNSLWTFVFTVCQGALSNISNHENLIYSRQLERRNRVGRNSCRLSTSPFLYFPNTSKIVDFCSPPERRISPPDTVIVRLHNSSRNNHTCELWVFHHVKLHSVSLMKANMSKLQNDCGVIKLDFLFTTVRNLKPRVLPRGIAASQKEGLKTESGRERVMKKRRLLPV